MTLFQPLFKEGINEICKRAGTSTTQLHLDVTALKEWLTFNPHLPQELSDDFITSFLFGCKNSIERVKQKLEEFYLIRHDYSEIFSAWDPLKDQYQETSRTKTFFPLPQLTPNFCRVNISTNTDPNPSTHDLGCYIQRVLATIELSLKLNPYCLGDYFIFDSQNFNFSHAAKITPTHLSIMLHCAQEAYPIQIKGIIFINASSAAEFVVNKLLKPMLKKKIAERVMVFTNGPEALYDMFPREILPRDYGGVNKSIEEINNEWIKKLEMSPNLMKVEGTKVDRPKRSSLLENDSVGVAGSFRRLEID